MSQAFGKVDFCLITTLIINYLTRRLTSILISLIRELKEEIIINLYPCQEQFSIVIAFMELLISKGSGFNLITNESPIFQ